MITKSTPYEELTKAERKLERLAGKKDWYPNADEFYTWAQSVMPNIDGESICKVFREIYP